MFEKLIPIIKDASAVGLFGHTHPDGDAMGSACALALALNNMGKRTRVFLTDCPDAQARSLIIMDNDESLEISDCDLLIALDCADSNRLDVYEEAFLAHSNTIAIDHHVTHKVFAKSGTVFTEISSTCELVYMLLREMGEEITRDIAANLYIGLVTDTGNLKYSNVTGNTLRVGAALIDTGIDFSRMSRILFTVKPLGYYRLMHSAIEKLRFICGGRAAVLYISDEDLHNAGITEEEANAIVTIPGSIEGIEVGVYIRKRSSGEFKVSLRSGEYMDVAEVASCFGGGGHIHASGYSAFDKTVDEIIDELEKELNKRWRS